MTFLVEPATLSLQARGVRPPPPFPGSFDPHSPSSRPLLVSVPSQYMNGGLTSPRNPAEDLLVCLEGCHNLA